MRGWGRGGDYKRNKRYMYGKSFVAYFDKIVKISIKF